jgi:predicted membrane protein
MPTETGHGTHRWGIGVLLTVIGLFILLSNLDVLDLGPFLSRWWPLLIVLLGLWKLVVWGAASLGSALLLIIIGLLCQLATLGVITWSAIFRLWPVLLIAIGSWMLLRPTRHWTEKYRVAGPGNVDFLDAWALFGGADRQVNSQQFKGGNATALFGGIDVDLRQAQMAEGEHSLHLTALFGGVDVFVPQNWNVIVTGTPILGSLEDKRQKKQVAEEATGGLLHISAFVVFGGIEIKN